MDLTKIQKFKIVYSITINGINYYNMIPYNNLSNRVDVENASNTNGANIKIYVNNSNYPSAQRFRFISNGDGTYRIMPQLSTTKVIEAATDSSSNGDMKKKIVIVIAICVVLCCSIGIGSMALKGQNYVIERAVWTTHGSDEPRNSQLLKLSLTMI